MVLHHNEYSQTWTILDFKETKVYLHDLFFSFSVICVQFNL